LQGLTDFFGTDEHVLADVRAACTTATFGRGALVFGEGDADAWVGVVLEGKARALRYSVSGTEVIASTFRPGAIFGEMTAIRGGRRSADVYALEDLKIARISGRAFVRLLQNHPALALGLCRLLADRVEGTTHRLFEEITLTSRHKVFAWLLRQATETDGPSAPRIDRMLSNSDLARQLNLARETVSRTISSLRKEGVIAADGEGLVIVDRHRLVSLLET
jgi:CRP-like cAMP-binding protein